MGEEKSQCQIDKCKKIIHCLPDCFDSTQNKYLSIQIEKYLWYGLMHKDREWKKIFYDGQEIILMDLRGMIFELMDFFALFGTNRFFFSRGI